jgi:hypothetical protein
MSLCIRRNLLQSYETQGHLALFWPTLLTDPILGKTLQNHLCKLVFNFMIKQVIYFVLNDLQ